MATIKQRRAKAAARRKAKGLKPFTAPGGGDRKDTSGISGGTFSVPKKKTSSRKKKVARKKR